MSTRRQKPRGSWSQSPWQSTEVQSPLSGARDTDRQAWRCGLQAIIQSVGQAGQSARSDAVRTHTHEGINREEGCDCMTATTSSVLLILSQQLKTY